MTKILETKPSPIRHYINIMLIVLCSVLILDLTFSVISIFIVQQQSKRYVQDTANLYVNQIDHNFDYINHYMGWAIVNNESAINLDAYNQDYTEFLKSTNSVQKLFTELQSNYGKEYNFFIYLKKTNTFLDCTPISLTYPEYQGIQDKIVSFVNNKNVFQDFYSKWTPIRLQDKYFIINMVPYHDRYLICIISADNLIRPLRKMYLGQNGNVSLVDKRGNNLTSPTSDVVHKNTAEAFLQSKNTIKRTLSNASFSINMAIKFGTFEKIMIAQLLIVLLFLFTTFMLGSVILYLRNKVLKPVLRFSENLAVLNENGESIDFKNSNIVELEQASTQFKNLVEQIKKFKIEIYERELEKQKIQLEFMKFQIRPHFFLNCLTSIYSMAQMQMYKEIESMTLSTSNYFRYIFQTEQDFVRLTDELDHVKIYLEIQKQRYQDSFIYHIEQEEDTVDASIPPLVLQTFIENAVKYAVSRVNKTHILLKVSRCSGEEQETVVIRITDTGPGFSADVLEKLNNGDPLDQSNGNHIGIVNTLKRLELLYHNKAKVQFSNMEAGGACIALYIPYELKQKMMKGA